MKLLQVKFGDKSSTLLIGENFNNVFEILDEEGSPFGKEIAIYDLDVLSHSIFKQEISNEEMEDGEFKRFITYKPKDKAIGNLNESDSIFKFKYDDYDSDNILNMYKFISEYKDEENEINLEKNFNLKKFMKIERNHDFQYGANLVNKLGNHIISKLSFKLENLIALNVDGTNDFVFGNSANIGKAIEVLRKEYPNLDQLNIIGYSIPLNDSIDKIIDNKDKSFDFDIYNEIFNDLVKEKSNFHIKDNMLIIFENENVIPMDEYLSIPLKVSFKEYCEANNKIHMIARTDDLDKDTNDIKDIHDMSM